MAVAAEKVHYCTVHTTEEATLRCNKCERWMCVKCAVQTPVGYRCRECIRGLENKFFTATGNDYLVIGAVGAGLGLLMTGILVYAGLGLFLALLAGVPAGGLISEAQRRVAGKRRGRYSAQAAAGSVVAGAALPLLFSLLTGGLLAALLFVGLAATTVYGRFNIYK
jgi:hypothetical protein